MANVTKNLKVFGRVQGVGFRYSLCDEAVRQKVVGWVKNLADGSVEAVVQGEQSDVNSFIAWIKKNPGMSQVERIEESDSTGEFKDFEIRY